MRGDWWEGLRIKCFAIILTLSYLIISYLMMLKYITPGVLIK